MSTQKRTLSIPATLYRSGTSVVDKSNKTIRLSISSDVPYLRRDWRTGEKYYEKLDHTGTGLRTERLKNGTSLLFNHHRDILLGRNELAGVEGGKLYVKSKISEAEDVKSYATKIDEGILVDSSVGYSVDDEGEETGEKIDGIPVIRFAWSANEASLVTIPADQSVGVNRQRDENKDEPLIQIYVKSVKTIDTVEETGETAQSPMADPIAPALEPKPQIDVSKERNEAVTSERKRVADIRELEKHFRDNGCMGKKVETREIADKIIAEGKDARAFQDEVMKSNPPEFKPVTTAENVGMNEKEIRSFSFLRAIRDLGTGRGLNGLEKEASNAHGKLIGIECGPNAFYAPMDVHRGRAFSGGISPDQVREIIERYPQTRALFSNVYSGAGAFVGTELMAGSLIELLRNQMLVVQMGARSLGGLTGNVGIPRQTGGATASWLSEDSTITATQQTVGQLNLTPHKLAAATAFTEQFAMQTSVDAENFVRQDLMAVTAIARDLGAIAGTGVSGQPVGILNLGAVNLSTPVTLSAAQSMTYANAVKFELNVSLNNTNRGRLGYMASPTVKNNAKLIAEIASTNSTPVWKDDRVNSYPALSTNQIPTATSVIFGNWDDLILADWAQSNFFVDPYSLSLQGQIRVINRLYCDNGVRHGTSFSVSVG